MESEDEEYRTPEPGAQKVSRKAGSGSWREEPVRPQRHGAAVSWRSLRSAVTSAPAAVAGEGRLHRGSPSLAEPRRSAASKRVLQGCKLACNLLSVV